MTALRKMNDDPEPVHVAVRMAAAIIEALDTTGHCRIQDMEAKGFSRDDLARYWTDAMKIVMEKRPRPGQRLH
ncbi:MAG: hypothetical protein KGJ13_07795 [Patescibacteria group bacterium]|nr:hypothetical protein [Patescibacteria group bacterium]